MKIITFTNQKGGTGKTTSAVSVSAGLARRGFMVLLLDLDPQGNSTTSAGKQPDEKDPTIYEVLKGTATAAEAIVTTDGGFDILPSDIRQAGTDLELAGKPGRDIILAEALKKVRKNYDYCIIDSPPSLSVVTLMAFSASNYVVITLRPGYLDLDGVAQLKDTLKLVKQRTNKGLEVLGIVMTFYDDRKNLHKAIAAQAEEGFPGKLFNTRISDAVALSEAPSKGIDIYRYSPRSKSARQYAELTNEIIERTKEK